MKHLSKDRLIFFFLALAAALYILSAGEPHIRNKAVGLVHTLQFYKRAPKGYALEQLEMENALLKAELEKKALAKPPYKSHLANIIRRDPFTPHVVWIDAGRSNCPFIEEESAVCIGIHAIGVVEEVSATRSKVRLLSDPKLHPSVRAARGSMQALLARHHLSSLKEMFTDTISQSALELIGKKVTGFGEGRLSTGYLCGFTSDEGLFYGKGFSPDTPLKKGDVLVTSGLDGIFPPGLLVARVLRVKDLESGALSYELFAAPTYPYHSLSALFVLPPASGRLGFEEHSSE